MTICNRCAQNIVAKHSLEQPKPKTCARCNAPLPKTNESISPRFVSRWLCPSCKEFVIERTTGACFVCGRPMTHSAFIKLRQAQKDPHLRPEYQQRVQGRQVA